MTRTVWRWGLCAALAGGGCLPGDGRPEPGEVLVEARRSDDARDGFTTDDGWEIQFDRFVTALGGLGLGDDRFDPACEDYSRTFYDRLFDFAASDTTKLHQHFGLGTCTLRYRMGSASDRVLLAPGVNEADRQLFLNESIDRFLGFQSDDDDDDDDDATRLADDDGTVEGTGAGLLVEGTGRKGSVEKRFRWVLFEDHAIQRCVNPDGSPFQVSLEGGDERVVGAVVRPRELFRLLPSDDGPIEFEAIAASDRNGDDTVTLDELAERRFPARDVLEALLGAEAARLPPPVLSGELTRREVLERISFPRLAAFDGVIGCEFVVTDLTIITSSDAEP
ncbi:MAG: hypothetical protein AAGN82_10995 [Myxococcota bacterium]